MWSYYPPTRRKSSTSSLPSLPPISPTRPIFSSALAESPEINLQSPTFRQQATSFGSPVTPGLLDPVDEHAPPPSAIDASGGSHAPLLTRDFASPEQLSRHTERQRLQPERAFPMGSLPDSSNETDKENEQHGESNSSFVALPTDSSPSFPVPNILRPPPPRKSTEPLLVPPASVHDQYVKSYISPITPLDVPPTQPPSPAATDARPPIFRASSAPGVPQGSINPRKLLPSPLPSGRPSDTASAAAATEGEPIFEIFNADLNVPAMDMVKKLKGHLEEVLKVQEEVGRMHLSLEKLAVVVPGQSGIWEEMDASLGTPEGRRTSASNGRRESSGGATPSSGLPGSNARTPGSTGRNTPGKGGLNGGGTGTGPAGSAKESSVDLLLNREKGIDEIMEKLGTLSERLRTYHTLGTPRLSFPQPMSGISPTSPSFFTRPGDASQNNANANPIKRPPPAKSHSQTQLNLMNSRSDISPPPPPLAVANLRGQTMPPRPLSALSGLNSPGGGGGGGYNTSTFSKSMTTLEESGSDSRSQSQVDDRAERRNSVHADRQGQLHSPVPRNSNLSPLSIGAADASPARKSWWGNEKGEDGWVENSNSNSNNGSNGHSGSNGDSRRGSVVVSPSSLAPVGASRAMYWNDRGAGGGKGAIDSPMETVDRSRPW